MTFEIFDYHIKVIWKIFFQNTFLVRSQKRKLIWKMYMKFPGQPYAAVTLRICFPVVYFDITDNRSSKVFNDWWGTTRDKVKSNLRNNSVITGEKEKKNLLKNRVSILSLTKHETSVAGATGTVIYEVKVRQYFPVTLGCFTRRQGRVKRLSMARIWNDEG